MSPPGPEQPDAVNPYAPPQSRDAPPPAAAPAADGFVYRSLHGFSWMIVAALAATILGEVGSIVNASIGVALMENVIAAREVAQADLIAYDSRTMFVTWFNVAMMVVCAIGFCLLMPRANRNARSFGCSALEFTPRASAGMFFVPILSLYKPYKAVKELWQASEWERQVVWQFAPTPVLLPLWWGAWISYILMNRAVSATERGGDTTPAGLITTIHAGQFLSAMCIVAAILCVLVVRGLAQRFERREQQLRASDQARAAAAG